MTTGRRKDLIDVGLEWVDPIPQAWEVRRLGHYFDERHEKVSDKDYPPLSVTMRGIVPQLKSVAKTDNGDNRKLVRTGDFVINSRSDRKGSGGLAPQDGSVSLINIVLEPQSGINIRFASYLLTSYPFQEEFYRRGKGIVADMWTTKYSEMKNIRLAVPGEDEQQAIASHLDCATARIDALVSKKTRFIELLREKRQELITHAVTKGLDASVPMKDSGIEWIGKIPKHWIIKPFYSFATEVYHPNIGLKERNLLSLSYGKLVRKDMNRLEGLTPASFENYNVIEANDIVFRLTDLQNDQTSLRSARARERGIITSVYITVRSKACPRFFEYLMRSYDTTKVFYGIGGGIRQSMNFADLKRLPIVVPPDHEMDLIAVYLERTSTRIDDLITKTERSIELLREHRIALITAAVTGKLDLRKAA